MKTIQPHWYHIVAILTVAVWGVTFVSTKVLIMRGLTPAEIYIYRFLLAYVGIWLISPPKLFSNNIKDELLFVMLGITGGSLYFMTENAALEYTQASNVALILAITPLLSAFLTRLFYKNEKLKSNLIWGFIISLLGVAFVVFNGKFVLQLGTVGDMLTLAAAVSWAFYNIILRRLQGQYSTIFITRKVFFYGMLTLLPLIVIGQVEFHIDLLRNPTIWLNLLFLSIVASLVCFVVWNTVVKKLGIVKTSSYLYLVPLVTMLTSTLVVDEKITSVAIIGTILILSGVYLAERGSLGR
ncbi:MAG: DMT family transporter [Prevotellaceae bacterium]|jgi:drug/metabolite transporter (DMT)-like permease|nr:DMT family transporter [Prevotellaceae bacterium]